MKPIYHGTVKCGLSKIKPFKRYTPGGKDVADAIPPRIYATYNPAYAVAHSFPWSSDDGVDISIKDGVITLIIPKDRQSVLEQKVCIYTLPDTTFIFTSEEETGLTYHSTVEVIPTNCECFDTVTIAIEHFGGNIQIVS